MTVNNRQVRGVVVAVLAIAVMVVGLFFGPGASAAQAQTADPCAIENFILSDGTTVDLVSYAACVEAQNALARTGSDVGQYIGIGSGLVALGAAFVWSSRRQRLNV